VELQFEVIQHRLLNEYGASCKFLNLNIYKACWLTSENPLKMEEFIRFKSSQIAFDKDQNVVYFADSQWIAGSDDQK
jgi:peptide chain release factor 3